MIKVSSLKRAEQRRLSLSRGARLRIFCAISLGAILFLFTYMLAANTFTPNLSVHSLPITTSTIHHPAALSNNQTLIVQLTSYSIHRPIHIVTENVQDPVLVEDDHNPQVNLPINHTKRKRINKFEKNLPEFDILKSTTLSHRFKKRAQDFFKDGCKVRFFMTWISSSMRVFGEREFLALDALFMSNPNSCLMILSNTMDSVQGFQILKPLTDCGFHVEAITPDLDFLFKNTPAQSWFDHIKSGKKDPGKIPLAQNLSNLIRLAILYKYGGVYLDTDFIILKDLSSFHNSIGAQSSTRSGNWTRLNNAVLIFDKSHPLLYKFMEEFALTFDGNTWGYNGPYLVSRVVEREAMIMKLDSSFMVLPPTAFYPVDWTRIGDFFKSPVNQAHLRWIEAKVSQLNKSTYGVHLWNKQSSRLRIQEGSIMARLVHDHCVICIVK